MRFGTGECLVVTFVCGQIDALPNYHVGMEVRLPVASATVPENLRCWDSDFQRSMEPCQFRMGPEMMIKRGCCHFVSVSNACFLGVAVLRQACKGQTGTDFGGCAHLRNAGFLGGAYIFFGECVAANQLLL